MIRITAPELRRVEEALLRSLGVSKADAAVVADVFVQSDLRGEESHGARLFHHVLGRIEAGGDNPSSEVTVVRDRMAVAVWDANRGLGQAIAARAMKEAIARARRYGVGIVGVRNANSYTSAKYYPLLAAQENMIGITYANSGRQLVVAHGGKTPVVGTNPLAIAAPTGKKPVFVLDMAISVAMERVRQANERGVPVPDDWGLDSAGRPTTEPSEIIASRALLPVAGAKGFGLGLAHEILTSVLMGGALFGAGATGFQPYSGAMNVSQYFQAINIDWFVPIDEFKQSIDTALAEISASEPRPGVDRVFYPGEHSADEEVRRLRGGIPLPPEIHAHLVRWCERQSVAPPVPI